MSPDLNSMSPWLKKDETKNGDVVLFADAGEIVDQEYPKGSGKFQKCFNISVQTPAGLIKKISLNKTSQDALMIEYGKQSEKWIGKKAHVTFVKMMISGKAKDCLVLVPTDEPFIEGR